MIIVYYCCLYNNQNYYKIQCKYDRFNDTVPPEYRAEYQALIDIHGR